MRKYSLELMSRASHFGQKKKKKTNLNRKVPIDIKTCPMHTAGRLGISNYKISIILTGIHLRSSSSSQVLNLVRPLKVAEAEDTPDPDPDPEPPDPEPIIEKVTLDDVDGFLKCTSLNARQPECQCNIY